jgi:hypothetical protein
MRDHYSYFDSSLSPYNFLTISDRRWSLVNSSLHYQNRLRRSDYLRLFEEAGFDVVRESAVGPTAAELELLRRLALEPRFRSYALEDLGAKSLALVARPRRAQTGSG